MKLRGMLLVFLMALNWLPAPTAAGWMGRGRLSGFVQAQSNNSSSEKRAALKAGLERAFVLLREAGVPFDPELLLEEDWPKRLAPIFDQIPEMNQNRYMAGPLSGVQLADTLYLPGHVETTGDTVILVRHIRFEGNDFEIKGNHYLTVYPAIDMGALGTTLPRKLVRSSQNGELEIEVEIPETLPPIKKGHVTVDSSGTSPSSRQFP